MSVENPLSPLIQQLSKLPGVGAKSAQRLAFFFLSLPPSDVVEFSRVLTQTRLDIRYCQRCFNLSFSDLCFICEDTNRVAHQLCVVADPKDIFALERTQVFKGFYHVLGGVLSPIDGIHPDVLRIPELIRRLRSEPITELVLAINPTIEGDATVLYLTHVLQGFELSKSKLAYGLPVGSDMDYADEMTLRKSVLGRTPL